MTKQMQNNVDTISPSLEDKLQRFAGDLTPEEYEQLRAIRTHVHDVAGMISSSLWDKAQAAVAALTPEEAAELGRVLGHASVTAAGSGAAEVTGYAIAEYEDAYGYKGKIGTGGESLPPAGGGTTLASAAKWGALLLITLMGTGGPVFLINNPEYRDPNF